MEASAWRNVAIYCGRWMVDCEGDCGSGIEEVCHAGGADDAEGGCGADDGFVALL